VLLTLSLFWVGVPLAPALAAVIVYRTLGLPLYVGGGMIARRLLWPLMRGSPGSAHSANVSSETSQLPPARPKA
jgi:hypothetical protein